uniref:Uncharacterized protein n=1 Tax=Opuntia streptacantha TaxID=393608 RepID=A0A7C9EQA2_OPUST
MPENERTVLTIQSFRWIDEELEASSFLDHVSSADCGMLLRLRSSIPCSSPILLVFVSALALLAFKTKDNLFSPEKSDPSLGRTWTLAVFPASGTHIFDGPVL